MKSLLIILICAFFFMATSPLGAETGTSQTKDEVRAWWGDFSTGFRYESNIFQDKNNKESDIIWESMISLAYQADKIQWSGRAISTQYQKNGELSYSSFEVGAERPFGNRDYGGLFLNLSPTAPLDKQEVNGFALGSFGVDASYDRDIGRLGNIGIALSYTRLDYDSPFNAKDTDIISLSPSHYYRMNDFWSFYSEYTYESGNAKAGTLQDGLHDDISYEAHAFSIKGTHRLSKKTSLRFRYRIRNKRFTTGDADNFHAGRKDTNHSLYGAHIYKAMKNLWVESRLDYLWRDSTEAFVEYNEHRLAVSITYQF